MAKVALISPPWGRLYGSYGNIAKAILFYPPLGLCYLAANLKDKGHAVTIIDAEPQHLSQDDVVREIEKYSPDIVGISSVSPIINEAESLAMRIKEKYPVPVVLGGPHVTIVEKEALASCHYFDFGVIGEGEYTFCELVEAIEKKPGKNTNNFKDVKGIIYRDNGQIINTEARPREPDLDSMLMPERSLVNHNNYLWGVPGKGMVPLATILTSRGCPFKCVFCSQDRMYGNKIRFHSAQKVGDEIEEIIRNTSAKHIVFCDDTLTLSHNHIAGICNEILKRELKLTWEGWTRANTVDKEILSLMKKAGLVRISFGIESGDEDILRLVNKGVSLENIRNAYKIAKNLGLETRGSAIIGLPYETKKSVRKTIKFLKNLKELDQPYINIAMPYPGTRLREMALRGEAGMKLLTRDYAALRRHDNAVLEVNDLTQEDLVRLQRVALLLCYLTPRRIWYNLTRAGWRAAFKNGIAFMTSCIKTFFKKHTQTGNDNFQKEYWEGAMNFFYRDYNDKVTEAYVVPKINLMRKYVAVRKNTKVLDVGAGKGNFSFYLNKVSDVTGVDFSITMLKQNPCIERMVNANANNLPFADGTFDIVFASNLLHHVANPQDVLLQMCRVSKRHIIIIEPNLLHLPMLLLLLLKKEERKGLRLTKRYIRDLARICKLRIIKFIPTGLIYQNMTPLFLIKPLKLFDRSFILGAYNLIILEKHEHTN